MKKVAVLLAAFNGESWLQEQIDSILIQRDVDVTLFVSIDPSEDGTEALVRNLSAGESRIVLLPTIERFGGAGANFFRLLKDVDFAKFDYVALSDQDDIWYTDKLSWAIEMMAAFSSMAYSSNVSAFWGDGREVLIDKAQKQSQFDFLFEAAGPGCTYVLKRGVVEELKVLLIANSEQVSKVWLHDWFIYAFARAKGYRWIIDPRSSMAYRQHASNQVGVNVGWPAVQARAKKIIGGWGVSQARLIARLIGIENQSFCKPWQRPGRLGMLWLALNAFRARRKVSDKIIFAVACLVLAVVGDRSDA